MFLKLLPVVMIAIPSQQAGDARVRDILQAADSAIRAASVASFTRHWRALRRGDSEDRTATFALATIARLTYDNERALELYRQLLAQPGERPDRMSAYASAGRALTLRDAGMGGSTDSAFVRALAEARAVGARVLEVEVLVYLAAIRARSHGPAEAERLFAEARSLLRGSHARLRALYHCGRAGMLLVTGQPEVTAAAAKGAGFAARAEDLRLHGICLMHMAASINRGGDLDSALVLYTAAIRDFKHVRFLPGLAAVYQWRGTIYNSVGALGNARRDLERAVALAAESHQTQLRAWALGNLAQLHINVGDLATAVDHAARAIDLFGRVNDRYGEVFARALHGRTQLAIGNLKQARTDYTQALVISLELSSPVQIYGSYLALAHIAMSEADWDLARQNLDAASTIAEEYGMPGYRETLNYHYGALALREGKRGEARRILQKWHDYTPEWQGDYRYMGAVRLAEAHAQLGNYAAAEAQLTAAFDALDAWRATLDSSRLRVLAFQRNEDYSDPDLGIATTIAALAENGRAAAAFELAERRRARGLLDQMLRARALLRNDSTGQAQTTADFALSTNAVTADWQSIAAAIPNDRTAILEYVTGSGGEPTTLFALTRSGVSAHVLPAADILNNRAARFLALLRAGKTARSLSRWLYGAMLEAAIAALPKRINRLVIVPSGPLHTFPFETLTMPGGRRVLERFTVGFAPSATVAARLWRRPDPTAGAGLLAFADPRLPAATSDSSALRGAMPSRLAQLERLPASARGAHEIARFARNNTILTRREARESRLAREDLGEFRILHFATHALVDNASLARTGLVLTAGRGEDGFVTPGEVSRLNLNAELVVLAACRTADGVAVTGEGVQGLTSAFLGAGARAVVASRWVVADAVSARLMEEFYRQMAAGLSAGAALRQAKLSAMQNGAPVQAWATYAIIGNALVRPPLRSPDVWTRVSRIARPAVIALTALLVGALAVVIVYRLRARKPAGARHSRGHGAADQRTPSA